MIKSLNINLYFNVKSIIVLTNKMHVYSVLDGKIKVEKKSKTRDLDKRDTTGRRYNRNDKRYTGANRESTGKISLDACKFMNSLQGYKKIVDKTFYIFIKYNSAGKKWNQNQKCSWLRVKGIPQS